MLDYDPDNPMGYELPSRLLYVYAESDSDLVSTFNYLTDAANSSIIDDWSPTGGVLNNHVNCLITMFGDFAMGNGENVSTLIS